MRAGRDRLAGAGLAVLLAGAVLAGPAGCKNKAAEMSRYPYFLTTLNERWEIARASLGSDKPDISYVVVLLKDLDGAAEALEWSYHGSNRDQAIAKLKDVAAKFRQDLSDKVDLRRRRAGPPGLPTVPADGRPEVGLPGSATGAASSAGGYHSSGLISRVWKVASPTQRSLSAGPRARAWKASWSP